jgi:hypothetical protein
MVTPSNLASASGGTSDAKRSKELARSQQGELRMATKKAVRKSGTMRKTSATKNAGKKSQGKGSGGSKGTQICFTPTAPFKRTKSGDFVKVVLNLKKPNGDWIEISDIADALGSYGGGFCILNAPFKLRSVSARS